MMNRKGISYQGETRVLDDAARVQAPGKFASLPDGMTHYELAGPPDGQPVVLVHGFSTPAIIWNPNFNALAAAGFCALRFDLYGRDFSDRPECEYDADLFDCQLLNLLDVLKIDRAVDLVGLSMGGAISVVFADRHPERVRRLCLLDPAGLPLAKLKLASWLARRTPLGGWLMKLTDSPLLVSAAAGVMERTKFRDLVGGYLLQAQFCGYRRALLATIRSGLVTAAEESYRRVGERGTPAMLIWGRKDQTVPFRMSARVRELMPAIEFHAIDDAGHASHYEQPQIVNPLLEEFLGRG